jgi:UPF0271 protein
MPRTIDLSADLGEGARHDAELLERVTSASVSCGAHAGTVADIAATLRVAQARGVVVGAHPGYPDREGFGRRPRSITADAARDLILTQVADLRRTADLLGVAIAFLKPHGALYNQAQEDAAIAAGVVAAAEALTLPVLGLPERAVEAEARRRGVRFVAEAFADRRYLPDGRLVPRHEPGALLTDPNLIAAQLLQIVDRPFETICIHGDGPDPIALADLVVRSLRRAGVAVGSFVARPGPSRRT